MSMNAMEYRGYPAVIEYSAEDECLIGRVVGIGDILVFDGSSIDEIRQNFHNVLDNYLALCEKSGKQPETPKSGKLSLRIPPELHAYIAQQSETTGESINSILIGAIQSLRDRERRIAVRKANKGGKSNRGSRTRKREAASAE